MSEHSMIRVGLVSVTLNAARPLDEFAKANYPDVCLIHYLDCGLQDLVRREGSVTPAAICRLISIFEKALYDKIDAILLSCTVFTPFVEDLKKLFPSIPIFSADGAMLEDVMRKGRKAAFLYTFPATLQSSMEFIKNRRKEITSSTEFTPFFVEGAMEASQSGNRQLHDDLIEARIKEAENLGFDSIVLSQVSMAHMARPSSNPGCTVYCSPKSAFEAVLRQFSRQLA